MGSDISSADGASALSSIYRPIFAGLVASLIGIGLARFAYTPLLPELIRAHWFSVSSAVYLSAANFAGYLLGALLARPFSRHIANVQTLRAMNLLATLCFLACAFPVSIVWYFVWRLLSGVAGGMIMVLVAATILPHVPAHRRGMASGAVFLGLGLGIAASGTLVPLLLTLGVREAWIGLAALSAVLTAASWTSWPPRKAPAAAPSVHSLPRLVVPAARILYVEYSLMAAGLVPTMAFLVDFVARGLHAGPRLGSFFWVLYGMGAIMGPPLYGLCADRLGAKTSLRLLLSVQVVAVGALVLLNSLTAVGLCCVIIGSFAPGIVPVMLARVREITPVTAHQNTIWTGSTIAFAVFQAFSAYAYSTIFDISNGSHRTLFAMAACALLMAIPVDMVCSIAARKAEQRP